MDPQPGVTMAVRPWISVDHVLEANRFQAGVNWKTAYEFADKHNITIVGGTSITTFFAATVLRRAQARINLSVQSVAGSR